MDAQDVKDIVRTRYGNIAAGSGAGCCPPSSGCANASGGALAAEKSRRMGYSADELAAVPDGANLGLGCGNPHAISDLQPGEVVVDLGSGGGFDCFLAARQVGPGGRVIGVDMTHEMLNRARDNARKIGAANVEFRLGEIEHLPVADDTAHVVMSNCVVNLAPDKARVFREAFRVLRPGGRLAISDVVNVAPLPPDLARDPGLLCGCVSGAATPAAIEAWLAEAGFTEIRVTVRPESREMIDGWAPGLGIADHVVSATIQARKFQPT